MMLDICNHICAFASSVLNLGLKWLWMHLAGTKRLSFENCVMQAFEHLCRSPLWNTQPAISCYIYMFSSFIADKKSSWTRMLEESAWWINGLFALVYLLISPSSPALLSVLSLGISFLIFYNLLLLCPSLSLSLSLSSCLFLLLLFFRDQTSLVEKHVERIHSLEAALRQRESSLHKLNTQLHNKDMQYLQLHNPDSHSKSCFVCMHAGVHHNLLICA